MFHKAGAEFVKAAPSVFKAWCRRAELRRLLAGGEVPCLAHCPRSGACNWPACSPALPAQLHPGCYLLSALWWPLSSVRAALISLTRRPRVWRCLLVRGTKASTARSATSATGVTQRSSCALKHGSCHPWLCVVRTWLIVDLGHLGRSALHCSSGGVTAKRHFWTYHFVSLVVSVHWRDSTAIETCHLWRTEILNGCFRRRSCFVVAPLAERAPWARYPPELRRQNCAPCQSPEVKFPVPVKASPAVTVQELDCGTSGVTSPKYKPIRELELASSGATQRQRRQPF